MRFGLIPVIMAACVAVGAAGCKADEPKQETTGTMQTQTSSDTGAAAGACVSLLMSYPLVSKSL